MRRWAFVVVVRLEQACGHLRAKSRLLLVAAAEDPRRDGLRLKVENGRDGAGMRSRERTALKTFGRRGIGSLDAEQSARASVEGLGARGRKVTKVNLAFDGESEDRSGFTMTALRTVQF